MKKIIITGILLGSMLSFAGCKKDKELVEVTIPEPEKQKLNQPLEIQKM